MKKKKQLTRGQLQIFSEEDTTQRSQIQYEVNDLGLSFMNLQVIQDKLSRGQTFKQKITKTLKFTRIISFKLSKTLLNDLRQFNYQNHQFQDTFLIRIALVLKQYEHTVQVKGQCQNIGLIILSVHFYLCLFTNLGQVIKENLEPISKKINITNIFNAWVIYDAVNNYPKKSDLQQYDVQNQYSQLEVKLYDAKQSQFANDLYLRLDQLEKVISGKGKYDLQYRLYLSILFNQQLYHPLFNPISKEYSEKFKQFYNKIIEVSNFYMSKQKVTVSVKEKFENDWFEKRKKQLVTDNLNLNQLESEIYQGIYGQKVQQFLIGMLGSHDIKYRDVAVKLLNAYYDGNNSQLKSSYFPIISRVGSKFKIDYLVQYQYEQQLLIVLKCRAMSFYSNQQITTYHKPKLQEYISKKDSNRYLWVSLDLGKFKKCGFYDWKLIRVDKEGMIKNVFKILNNQKKENIREAKPIQGRFIIHYQKVKELQIHQIFIDQRTSKQNVSEKGNFRSVKSSLQYYKQLGVNCLYLLGVYQRDNGYRSGKQGHVTIRTKVSPLSVICRSTVNSMLGGQAQFNKLITRSKQLDLKILVDCLTRVSSSRMHKKYRNNLVYFLDSHGKKMFCYGTDGRALIFQDTVILNYRKKQVWDLHIEEIKNFIKTYGIDGIHLDSGQSWPQILKLDQQQMFRQQSDGTPAYSIDEIFEGNVVKEGYHEGYWATNSRQHYPNPFLIKFCKQLWKQFPNLIIVSECWGSVGGFDERFSNIISSGPIPRLFKLPAAICYIFGQNLHKDGTISKIEPKDVNALKQWYKQTRECIPRGSIIAQSTTSHNWPYPALLYKRATWPVIDLFFYLPDIPMTFIGQQEGKAFRVKTTNVFTKKDSKLFLEDKYKNIEKQKLKILDSTFFQQDKEYLSNYVMGESQSNLAAHQLKQAEESFRWEIGPQFGFDLKQIGNHYKVRRKFRAQNKTITRGKFISLYAMHMYGYHKLVLAFALYRKNQIGLVAINFNEGEIFMHFNLKVFNQIFPDAENSNLVVQLIDNIQRESNLISNFYYIGDFINDRIDAHLPSYGSLFWKVRVCHEEQKAIEGSKIRCINKINSAIPKNIYSSTYTNEIIKKIEEKCTLKQFFNIFRLLIQKMKEVQLNILLSKIKIFQINRNLCNKLFSYIKLISKYEHKCPQVQTILQANKMGTIAFVTPEIGKWSTAGGLGVMVDQLTKQLAAAGQEIVVISPYYQTNKKGQKDYLRKEGFQYIKTIDIWSGSVYFQIGIHGGKYGNVLYYFLHNPIIFPYVYEGQDPFYIMKQLVFFAKGCLETFCHLKINPVLIVQNDWFSGLIGAYIKVKKFGDYFNDTKVLHIIHNLDQLYEGRIYPNKEHGNFSWLTQLPYQFLIDPFWNKLVCNPSRCALMNCDNWATVSHSYKIDLLNNSPLSPLLHSYPSPFSFPNGVRKNDRLLILKQKTVFDYQKAKEQIQKKYFGYDKFNSEIPIFSFIGRITKQKGVYLILQAVQELIYHHNFKILFLIGGPSNCKEDYGRICTQKLLFLKQKFPNNIWCNPYQFFYNGPLINIGSDFGLMPSMFEPGGIVQHEFFIASTPVVAFRTGGLKDTVFEYDYKKKKGNGCNFIHFNRFDFVQCINRAVDLFHNKQHFQICKKNAFQSVIDVIDVAKAWNQQFHRMQNKLFVQWNQVDKFAQLIEDDGIEFLDNFEIVKKKGHIQSKTDMVVTQFEKVLSQAKRLNIRHVKIQYWTEKLPFPKKVSVIGEWNNWEKQTRMTYDSILQKWQVNLKLLPGTYKYKYIVDDQWVCSSNQLQEMDIKGNLNNIINIL